MRRHFLSEKNKLNKPSRTFTVGPDSCDFTSLVDALQNGAEGDMFIVFGGIHDGKLNLRKDQSIHCIGKVTLRQTANDYLFYFRQPSDYDAGNPGLYEVNWSGSLPSLQFSTGGTGSRWISYENNFLAAIDMSSLYLQHKIHFTQAGSDYPVISSFTSNLIVNADWFNPIHEDTGECSLTIFTDAISLNPVREKQSFSVSSLTINRFPFWTLILICII